MSLENLRTTIRKFEDRKITPAQLGREVLHAANSIHDPSRARLRQTLARLGNRCVSLAERGLHDDVAHELRAVVDDLVAELVDHVSE